MIKFYIKFWKHLIYSKKLNNLLKTVKNLRINNKKLILIKFPKFNSNLKKIFL